MDEQQTSQSPDLTMEQGQMVITLELDNPERESDPALVLAVGNTTVTDLLQEQYVLRQHYTGRKGGFLVQFVVTSVQFAQFAQLIVAQHAEIIADLSGLVTIFSGVLPILQKMSHAHRKHTSKEESERNTLKIEVEIDGGSIRIEAPDLIQAEGALKLAQKFHSAHPGIKPTPQSTITVRSQVPARKRPRRR